MKRSVRIQLLTALLLSSLAHAGGGHPPDLEIPVGKLLHPEESTLSRRWAFEVAVAWITPNEIDDIYRGRSLSIDHGDAGGNIYYLTASYHPGDLPFELFGMKFTPRMELPLTLAVFDENSRSPFLDYNAAFSIRWVDFPWNRYLKTSFMTGVGLSYSDKVPLMDIQRHRSDGHRSNLKINWPIQLTFALPSQPEYQLSLFIDHQSGGHIFDVGGMNSVGIGFRYQPD